MLARVAGSLYWIGRYLERCENVARLLLVAAELSVELEGLDERLAEAEWDDLQSALPGCGIDRLEFSRETGLAVPYVKALLLDEHDPLSVRHSLGRARENARSIREALTREVFTNLNELHRDLEAVRRRGLRDPVGAHHEVARAHREILTILGAIEHTMSRDQGWTFMKLGEALERTQRTLLVLRARLPGLRAQEPGPDLPLYYARWRGLLRSLASLENYRALHGARLEPGDVVRFMLFDAAAPRSVACGVQRLQRYLAQLPGGERVSEAGRILGRLHSTLTYEDEDILAKTDLPEFCGEVADALARSHEAIARQYFPS